MSMYYLCRSELANGDHELHAEGCTYLVDPGDCIELGEFDSCRAAMREAKQCFEQCNGCVSCCHACHTQQDILN